MPDQKKVILHKKKTFSSIEGKKNKLKELIKTKKRKGGTRSTHTQLSDIPEDLTIKMASKTTLQSLRLLNMTHKTYRTQLKPLLTTNMYPNQFHIIDEDASDIMDLYSITLNHIINSSINIDFFDKFIYTFTITKPIEQCTYIYNNLFNFTEFSKTKLSLLMPREEITNSFLSEIKINKSIFKGVKPTYFHIDYRIFQFLLFMTGQNMKGRSSIIMKISLIKHLMIFMGQIFVDKILKHYAYISDYIIDDKKQLNESFKKILDDANIVIESYIFDKRFMRDDYCVIENLDIFFFYLYSVIVSAIIFENDLFVNLSAKQKYSIKIGMIYDMIYYIKSIYSNKIFGYRQQYTILFLFNIYNFIEKDKYFNLFIRLILFKYINHLFENKIITLDILHSDDISFAINIISESIPKYLDELSTLDFVKVGLPNQKQIDIEINKNILSILAKNLDH
jgi:hypothetical protein